MNPDSLHKLFEKTIKKVLLTKGISEDKKKEYIEKIDYEFSSIANEIASLTYKTLRKSQNSMLKERRNFFKGFEKRHYKRWKEGIDLLESFIVFACEIGDNFNSYYRDEAVKTQDYLFEALTNLHARSIQIGFEVLNLLCSGFADGAHARWRTAHEIAVIANFLVQNDQELANKYLVHEVIESYRAMIQYQKYKKNLGLEEISKQEILELEEVYKRVINQYGKDFSNMYGWSADVLNNKNPKFIDIEKAVKMDHFRPYYKHHD